MQIIAGRGGWVYEEEKKKRKLACKATKSNAEKSFILLYYSNVYNIVWRLNLYV